MRHPKLSTSLPVNLAVAGILSMGAACKGKGGTQEPGQKIELANVSNIIVGLGSTKEIGDDKRGFYGYQTTEEPRDAAYRQLLIECMFSLPQEALHGEVTENRREICYVVNDGARNNCVAVTLNPREDKLFDGTFVHKPRGPVTTGPIGDSATEAILTPEENDSLINLWEEEVNACYYLMEQYGNSAPKTQGAQQSDGKADASVKVEKSAEVDSDSVSAEVKVGGKAGAKTNDK